MNKDEVMDLAKSCYAAIDVSSDGYIAIFTSAELLAFANACEKIGMENAATICHSRYMGDNNREDAEALRCEEAIRKAI